METINVIYPLWIWFALPWWVYLLIIFGGGGTVIFAKLLQKAAGIIIMGAAGTGKSTLWNKLNPKYVYNPHSRGGKDVESFTIKRTNGSSVTISKTKDFGGEDIYFRNFIEEIKRKNESNDSKKENLFIFYLIRSTDLDDNKMIKDTRSRIKIIFDEFKDNFKEKKLGFNIILSHFDTYCSTHMISLDQISEAKEDLKDTLSKKFSGHSLTKSNKKIIRDITLIGSLNDQTFINEIKDKIGIKNENS